MQEKTWAELSVANMVCIVSIFWNGVVCNFGMPKSANDWSHVIGK